VVRLAEAGDAVVVIDLVSRLLVELGGSELDPQASQAVYRRLAEGDGGFVVLGEVDGVTSAICTVSVQEAPRTAGPYAIVQEMT
jgi:hypothetical protein